MILHHRKKKKKIRGWKRQVRKIEHWKQAAMALPLRELEEYERVPPLHVLKRRKPPLWYQQLLLEALLDVSEYWQQKLQQARKDCELQLWLFLPHMTESQIVVSTGESRPPWGMFDPDPDPKPFPGNWFPRLKARLDQLDWNLHIESDVFTKSDLKKSSLASQEIKQILGKVYQQTELHLCEGKKETIYSIKVGEVWVGRFK
jgi:hypothetical protein